MAAVVSDADFVIASAASGLPMDRVEVFSISNAIDVDSLPPEEAALARAWVEAMVAVAYHGAPKEGLEARTEAARGHDWFFEPPAPAIVAAIEQGAAAPVTARVFAGADHTFRIRRPGDVWPRTFPGYPEALVEWLEEVAGARPEANP